MTSQESRYIKGKEKKMKKAIYKSFSLIILSFMVLTMNSCAAMFDGTNRFVKYDTSKSVQSQTNLSYRERTTSNASIKPISTLSIESSPDADIYIDGEFAGKGVVSNKEVKHKEEHNIVVKQVGFKTQLFTLRPDGTFV